MQAADGSKLTFLIGIARVNAIKRCRFAINKEKRFHKTAAGNKTGEVLKPFRSDGPNISVGTGF
jgi:hypothetical protein